MMCFNERSLAILNETIEILGSWILHFPYLAAPCHGPFHPATFHAHDIHVPPGSCPVLIGSCLANKWMCVFRQWRTKEDFPQ